MSPEQQAIVKALLMQGGQMTPMQQNQGSQGSLGGFMTEYAYPDGTAIMRAPKGQRYADQLFRTHPDGTGSQLDSTDLQEFVPGAKTTYRPADKSSQAYDFPQNEAAMASPRPQASPMRGMPAPNPADDVELQQTMWARMSPEQKAQVMAYVQQGAPIDQALDAVADMDRNPYSMNAAARGQ